MGNIKEIAEVTKDCKIIADKNGETVEFIVDTIKFPYRKYWIGKKVGDIIRTNSWKECTILKIEMEEKEKPLKALDVEIGAELTFIMDQVVKTHKKSGYYKNINKGMGNIREGLEIYKTYGTAAFDIYCDACKEFGWDYSKKYIYSPRRLLFENNVTPEGFAVWFIPYSDLNVSVNSSGKWTNVYNDEYIYEVWHDDYNDDDQETRVTFIKQGDGQYVYIGVYTVCESINISKTYRDIHFTRLKIYKRIETIYP